MFAGIVQADENWLKFPKATRFHYDYYYLVVLLLVIQTADSYFEITLTHILMRFL